MVDQNRYWLQPWYIKLYRNVIWFPYFVLMYIVYGKYKAYALYCCKTKNYKTTSELIEELKNK